MRERVYLYDAISSNRRRIALGVFVFFAVILVESTIIAAIIVRNRAFAWRPFALAFIAALGATIVLFPLLAFWAYYRGKQTLLKPFWTVELSDQDARKLRRALSDVCIAAGVERPEVQVIANNGVNAISLAKGYREGLILVTRGAAENLDREELEAMLAHEICHIISHDTWMWMLGLGVSAFLPLVFSAYWAVVGKMFDEKMAGATAFLFNPQIFFYVLAACMLFIIAWLMLAAFWIPL